MANIPDNIKLPLNEMMEKLLRSAGAVAGQVQGIDWASLWDVAGSDTFGTSSAMSSGTVTVSAPTVKANSKIFLTHAGADVTQAGVLTVGTITPGTSFVINSKNALDVDTVNWWILNP